MGCTSFQMRKLMVEAVKNGGKIGKIAEIFGVCRQTVSKWVKRFKREGEEGLKDKSRRPHSIHRKVSDGLEKVILLLRKAFKWGTQRIRVAIKTPPNYIKYLVKKVIGIEWKPIKLSRQSINKVLKKHGLNGNPYGAKSKYKRFEMDKPNDLWQVDVKGPFRMDYHGYYALIAIDDHSRYLIACDPFESIDTDRATAVLENKIGEYGKPKRLLVDHGPRFRKKFSKWCKGEEIILEYTPLNYPQGKGKVERVIRTFNEEFLRLGNAFKGLMEILPEFSEWYNNDRENMGIKGVPADRYFA